MVRHGKTAWNLEGRFLGRTDQGLDETGHRQARQAAELLSQEPIGFVFSSTLRRAWETAQYIATAHQLPVQRLDELVEMNFGCWEGMTFNEIKHNYPELIDLWVEDPFNIRIPGGETAAEVWQRIETAWQKIVAEAGCNMVVVVAHGGTLRLLANLLTGVPGTEQWFYNPSHGEILVLEHGDSASGKKWTAPYRLVPHL